MPRLKYWKIDVPGRDEPVKAFMMSPAEDKLQLFRQWQAWKRRVDDAPLPDGVDPVEAQAYREWLRSTDRAEPPREPLGPCIVIIKDD